MRLAIKPCAVVDHEVGVAIGRWTCSAKLTRAPFLRMLLVEFHGLSRLASAASFYLAALGETKDRCLKDAAKRCVR